MVIKGLITFKIDEKSALRVIGLIRLPYKFVFLHFPVEGLKCIVCITIRYKVPFAPLWLSEFFKNVAP